ncbi:glycosyltransferase [Xenorhabdus bovienii]|uniref:glycosyltransferase n=1 Tax=Xenorhabdus bovienii TaxID=40576 RepID=UPI0023B309B0|nr:glycosyltransferase [Xenorhabdus bovienii]MDE9554965.1 glycosyltransferase [Xenorhabdus bovienii]
MKILQISKLYPPFWGGIETVVYDISSELSRKGNFVDILCVSDKNENTTEVQNNGKIFRCGSILHLASTYISLSFLFKWMKIRKEYDIIHVHLPNPLALLAVFLFRPSKDTKIIVHWHSDIVKQKFLKIPFIPLQKWLLKKCKFIIATSKSYAQASKDIQNYSNKIQIVPIGIDSTRMESSDEKQLSIKKKHPNKKIVFSLGRHVYYKGFKYLIESAEYLSDEYVILLGGTGDQTECLINLSKKKKLYNKKIFFLGKIEAEHLSSYYSVANVFCLPSIERSEAFGVVQLEAMSCGTPVISTEIDGSGVPWVNKTGVSGLTVPIKDPLALADAIISLCESPLDKNKIKDFFYTNYSREVMVDKIIKLYS